MIRLSLSSGDVLLLQPSPIRKFRGLRIPGSSLHQLSRNGLSVSVQIYAHRLFTITLRDIQCGPAVRLITTEETNWLRLEIPLSGSLSMLFSDGSKETLPTGYYQLTTSSAYAVDLQQDAFCTYFTVNFSAELLVGIDTDEPLVAQPPAVMPTEMHEMVHELLKCPFQGSVRDFYYSNKIRELLFAHAVATPVVLPGDLRRDQVALMYEADRIMASNLDGKITIPQLARTLGTNFVTLKRNYEKVFGIGLFPRLMQRKMDHIQLLLENTDKPLKEIADLAGYQTLPGFINAFRKRFGQTPGDWRKVRRGS